MYRDAPAPSSHACKYVLRFTPIAGCTYWKCRVCDASPGVLRQAWLDAFPPKARA